MKTCKQLMSLFLIICFIASALCVNAVANSEIDFTVANNLAYKKSVSSPGNNCYSGGPLGNLTDGKISTQAQTHGGNNANFQVIFDLGDFYDVSEVTLYSQKNDSYALKVYLSSGSDYTTGQEIALLGSENGTYTDSTGASAAVWKHTFAPDQTATLIRYVIIKFNNYKYGYYTNEIFVSGAPLSAEATPDISSNLLKNRVFESNNSTWYASSKVNATDGQFTTVASMDASVNAGNIDDMIFDMGGSFALAELNLYVGEDKFCEGYNVYTAVDSPDSKEFVGTLKANRIVYAEDGETKVWEYNTQMNPDNKVRYVIIEALKAGYASAVCEVVALGNNVLAVPDKPEWNENILLWNSVDGATGYNLYIYKNDELVKTVSVDTNQVNIEQYLDNSGSYTIGVCAISSDADESPESLRSEEYSFRKEGDDEILTGSIATGCPINATLGGGFDSGLWDNPEYASDGDLTTSASISKSGASYTDAITIDLGSEYEITEVLVYVSPEHDVDAKPYRVYASVDKSDYTGAGSVKLEADGLAYLDGEVVAKRINAKPVFDEQFVRYITIAAEGNKYNSKINEIIIKGIPCPRLDTVAKPEWKDRVLFWKPVEFATEYKVDLYKDGKLMASKTVANTTANFRGIIEYSVGSYTATVVAMAEGHNSSFPSEVTDEFIIDGTEKKNLALNQSVYKISSIWYDNTSSKPQWANDGDFTTMFASKATEAGYETIVDELCIALTSGSWLIEDIIIYSSWRSGMKIDVYGTSDRSVPRQHFLGTIGYDSTVTMDGLVTVKKHTSSQINNPETGVKYITLLAQGPRMGMQMEEIEIYGTEVPKLGALDTPSGLVWNGKTISWSPVEGATQYTVSLKRNGNLVYSDITNSTSVNLENMIKGYGSYTVTVLADAPGTNWSQSAVSEPSDAYVIDDEPVLSNAITISQKDALQAEIYKMKNMFDGDLTTSYMFESPVNEPIAVSLSEAEYIEKICISQVEDASNIGKITVSVSENSVSWESFDCSFDGTGEAEVSINDKIRYIKFDFKDISFTPAGISEISIYPSASPEAGDGSHGVGMEKTEIPEVVKKGYSLPTEDDYGNKIKWSSSDSSVIYVDGTKTVINPKSKDVGVTITATISLSGKEYVYKYQITVKGEEKKSSGGSSSSKGSSAGAGSSFLYGDQKNEVVAGVGENVAKPVTDELTNHWAQKEIKALIDAGIIQGSNNGLELGKSTTRAEFAKMLCEAFDFGDVEYGGHEFSDVEKDSWYYDSVMKLCAASILSGYPEDNTLRPDDIINREEMSKLIAATVSYFDIEASSDKQFAPTDINDISNWALPYVESAYSIGLLNGFEDGSFRPKSDAKREQAMVLIYRMLEITGRW